MISQQQRREVDSEIEKILQVIFCIMNEAVMWKSRYNNLALLHG